MNKKEKEQILAAIKAADDNAFSEQDTHRGRITAMESVGNKDYLKTLPDMGWEGIAKAMVDERSPPCQQDRLKYLGRELDEAPSRIQLDQIEDEDIRHHTYFLGEVADHCERIKASAKFLENLNASPDDRYAGLLFSFWYEHSVVSQLAAEQKEAGNHDNEQAMREIAKSTEELFDITVKIPELFEILNHKEEESEIPKADTRDSELSVGYRPDSDTGQPIKIKMRALPTFTINLRHRS